MRESIRERERVIKRLRKYKRDRERERVIKEIERVIKRWREL